MGGGGGGVPDFPDPPPGSATGVRIALKRTVIGHIDNCQLIVFTEYKQCYIVIILERDTKTSIGNKKRNLWSDYPNSRCTKQNLFKAAVWKISRSDHVPVG